MRAATLTTMVSKRTAYRKLCRKAARGGHVLKLSRVGDEGWGLQLLAPPNQDGAGWRAAGVLFPTLAELDSQAGHLLRWVRALEPSEE